MHTHLRNLDLYSAQHYLNPITLLATLLLALQVQAYYLGLCFVDYSCKKGVLAIEGPANTTTTFQTSCHSWYPKLTNGKVCTTDSCGGTCKKVTVGKCMKAYKAQWASYCF